MSVMKKTSGTLAGSDTAKGFLSTLLVFLNSPVGGNWSVYRNQATTDTGRTCTADHTTDLITLSGHGFITGDVVTFTTDGAAPTGLTFDGDQKYYVSVNDANSFYVLELTSTLPVLSYPSNGAAVATFTAFSSNGTGTHTCTRWSDYFIASPVSGLTSPSTRGLTVKFEFVTIDTTAICYTCYCGWDATNGVPVGPWSRHTHKITDSIGGNFYIIKAGTEFLSVEILNFGEKFRFMVDTFEPLATMHGAAGVTATVAVEVEDPYPDLVTVVEVASAEEAQQFYVGQHVWITDFSRRSGKKFNQTTVCEGVIEAIGDDGLDPDQIRFTYLTNRSDGDNKIFVGSIVTPFPFPWYVAANITNDFGAETPVTACGTPSIDAGHIVDPAYNCFTTWMSGFYAGLVDTILAAKLCVNTDVIESAATAANGDTIVQRPVLVGYQCDASVNLLGLNIPAPFVYGVCKNMYFASMLNADGSEKTPYLATTVIDGLTFILICPLSEICHTVYGDIENFGSAKIGVYIQETAV